jgi:hypothetical protein
MKKTLIYLNLIFYIGITNIGFANSISKKEGGWKSLFDGKTLNGWIIDNAVGKCYVEENVIVGEITPIMYYLRSEKKYDNFILEFEFKVDSGVNSGVQIRSEYLKTDTTCRYTAGDKDLSVYDRSFKAGEFGGYQFEIESTERAWCGGFYEQCGRGWIYPLIHNEPAKKALKRNDWNHLRIIANKDHFQSWLNEAKASDCYDKERTSGFIGFQLHDSNNEKVIGKKIRFRNIRIKEL